MGWGGGESRRPRAPGWACRAGARVLASCPSSTPIACSPFLWVNSTYPVAVFSGSSFLSAGNMKYSFTCIWINSDMSDQDSLESWASSGQRRPTDWGHHGWPGSGSSDGLEDTHQGRRVMPLKCELNILAKSRMGEESAGRGQHLSLSLAPCHVPSWGFSFPTIPFLPSGPWKEPESLSLACSP